MSVVTAKVSTFKYPDHWSHFCILFISCLIVVALLHLLYGKSGTQPNLADQLLLVYLDLAEFQLESDLVSLTIRRGFFLAQVCLRISGHRF